jgi:hypothetical protein
MPSLTSITDEATSNMDLKVATRITIHANAKILCLSARSDIPKQGMEDRGLILTVVVIKHILLIILKYQSIANQQLGYSIKTK